MSHTHPTKQRYVGYVVCYLCLQFLAGTDTGAVAAVIIGTVPAAPLLVATAPPLPVAVIIAGRPVPIKAPDSCDGSPAVGVCVFLMFDCHPAGFW